MTPDRVRYAYAGTWYRRPSWTRWEVIGALIFSAAVIVVFGWPVAAYIVRQT